MRALALLLLAAAPAWGQYHLPPPAPVDPLAEVRCCKPPPRNPDGSIKRSSAVLAAFRRANPCPSTGLTTGPCEGWSMDHSIPLACGGLDIVANVTWMPIVLKSGPGTLPKDRWERRIYCDRALLPMPERALPLAIQER